MVTAVPDDDGILQHANCPPRSEPLEELFSRCPRLLGARLGAAGLFAPRGGRRTCRGRRIAGRREIHAPPMPGRRSPSGPRAGSLLALTAPVPSFGRVPSPDAMDR